MLAQVLPLWPKIVMVPHYHTMRAPGKVCVARIVLAHAAVAVAVAVAVAAYIGM